MTIFRQLIPYMAQAIVSQKSDMRDNISHPLTHSYPFDKDAKSAKVTARAARNAEDGLALRWSGRISLTTRILAVNIFAIAILAGGLFYLDSYRARLIAERLQQAAQTAQIIADAAEWLAPAERVAFLGNIAKRNSWRLRLYNQRGVLRYDSFANIGPSYILVDPDSEPFRRDAARFLDRSIDAIVGAPAVPQFHEPARDIAAQWPELQTALQTQKPVSLFRYADDRTPVISAASPQYADTGQLLITYNARDITRFVRAERFSLSIIILATSMVSILLSLFLARTIVRPLRMLARAAIRVRLGRAREVIVPRLPSRRDEIGLLARSLSDMSLALRKRIDATETFAADVSHEIKNPLASLRSALDGLKTVHDPALRQQLLDIADSDVLRMDRLITDISEVSRVDAQLSRTRFEPIDLGAMIESLIQSRETSGQNNQRDIAFARPRRGVAMVMGEATRLERVITNLLDNAISFSPEGGVVQIFATRSKDQITLRISDQGPGVPKSEREAIFRRFHTDRPAGEGFGKHSGLGLAIARTIIEAHQGTIIVRDREDSEQGACFEVLLPAISDVMPPETLL